jgi:hypothetical protein
MKLIADLVFVAIGAIVLFAFVVLCRGVIYWSFSPA